MICFLGGTTGTIGFFSAMSAEHHRYAIRCIHARLPGFRTPPEFALVRRKFDAIPLYIESGYLYSAAACLIEHSGSIAPAATTPKAGTSCSPRPRTLHIPNISAAFRSASALRLDYTRSVAGHCKNERGQNA